MAMRDNEQSRWDVRLPERRESRGESWLKTMFSGIVLLALIGGPMLMTNGKESEREALRSESSGAPIAQAAAVTWDGTEEGKTKVDSTGAQDERYFPGRQAM